jgi:hypothetical protein
MVETITSRLEGVIGAFLGLAWISTGLRIYVRCFIRKCWGVDDSLLIAALVTPIFPVYEEDWLRYVFFTIFCSCTLAGIPLGIGRRTADIPLENMSRCMQFWWLFQIFFTAASVILRCSIAVFILRICEKRTYKLIIYTSMGTVIAFSIFYLCLLIFQCRPISLFWNQYAVTQSTAD